MLNWIRQIVALGIRRPGSPGDLATESFLEQQFRQFGLAEVHREPVPLQYWAPTETSLTLSSDDNRSISSFAVPYTACTQPLRRNLIFVASSGHFHGGIGNRVFVQRHRDGMLRNTVAALGIEHIAQEAEADGQGGYQLTGQPELRVLFVDQGPRLLGLLEEAVEKWQLERTLAVNPYLFGPEPPCDSAPFFTAGIPSVCHISGPLYLFDPHDTVDKVRADDLPRVAAIFRQLIESIDNIPAAELAEGLQRGRDDPQPPMPSWFCKPEDYPRPE